MEYSENQYRQATDLQDQQMISNDRQRLHFDLDS